MSCCRWQRRQNYFLCWTHVEAYGISADLLKSKTKLYPRKFGSIQTVPFFSRKILFWSWKSVPKNSNENTQLLTGCTGGEGFMSYPAFCVNLLVIKCTIGKEISNYLTLFWQEIARYLTIFWTSEALSKVKECNIIVVLYIIVKQTLFTSLRLFSEIVH